jgi:hypothetical protein
MLLCIILILEMGFGRPVATIIVNSGEVEPISPNWVEECKTLN